MLARSLSAPLAAILLLASGTVAHTWVEEVRLVGSNGSYVGDMGYARAFAPRSANVDYQDINLNLVPPNGQSNVIKSTELMCNKAQTIGSQTKGFPTLTAAPLDNVALRYEENGHVTLWWNQAGKPAGRGTVFVYGTKSPANTDTYLGIHRVWNAAGTGGDKRGKLLATRPFDDGRCFQANGSPTAAYRSWLTGWPQGGADLMCQSAVQLPSDAGTSGTYTLYWVWEWPSLAGNGASAVNESYTSCIDISMTSKSAATNSKNDVKNDAANVKGVSIQSAAVQNQLSFQYLVDPTAAPSTTSDNPPTAAAANPPETASIAEVSPTTTTKHFLPVTTGSGQATGTGNSKSSSAIPEASAATTATVTTKTKASTSTAPAGGFVTITVTATEKEMVTVTVTNEPAIASTQETSKSVVTTSAQSQIPSSVETSIDVFTATTTATTPLAASPEASSKSSPTTTLAASPEASSKSSPTTTLASSPEASSKSSPTTTPATSSKASSKSSSATTVVATTPKASSEASPAPTAVAVTSAISLPSGAYTAVSTTPIVAHFNTTIAARSIAPHAPLKVRGRRVFRRD